MALRATLFCLKKYTPSPSAPTQELLRLVEKLGTPTSEQLWDEAKKIPTFNSKNHMKKSLRVLCKAERLITKPADPTNHKVNFIFKLGRRPDIVRQDQNQNQQSP